MYPNTRSTAKNGIPYKTKKNSMHNTQSSLLKGKGATKGNMGKEAILRLLPSYHIHVHNIS